MRFRAAHFACLLVLLSAFGAADAAARSGQCRDCAALHVLLSQIATVSQASASAPALSLSSDEATNLSAADRTQTAAAWTMHPPAAHTVAQHATTGSGL